MLQKVLKVGSSAAVVIPKKSLKELGIAVGDMVNVSINERTKKISVQAHLVSATPSAVDSELMAWTKKFIDRYRPALEALAKK